MALISRDRAPGLTSGTSHLLDQRLNAHSRRLFIGGERSVRRALVTRTLLVMALFATVIVIFIVDRDGLSDETDHHVSIVDVVYFSVITVTTVGYGDIVPVTPQARLVDALLVTPIRLFIWLIFLGTAYQLVLQRIVEGIRMRIMESRLSDHVVICGFGHAGRSAAAELRLRGTPPAQIVVVDSAQERVEEAAEAGYVGLHGDATREDILTHAKVHTAQAVLVATGRDDTTVLAVLTLRSLCPHVRIVASVREPENEKLVRQSGADATVLPSRVGGLLMADSLESSAVASAVMDLISAGGHITLVERAARPDEVGRLPAEIVDSLIVRVLRDAQELAFWEQDARIRTDDRLVVIRPV